nr:MAG TPA: Renin receptor-like protein [Caudoviricetes sp.]
MNIILWVLFYGYYSVIIVLWVLCCGYCSV